MKLENFYPATIDGIPTLTSKKYLAGIVYGKAGYKDGSLVRTSGLKFCDEKTAETSSGSLYELGTIHRDFVEMDVAARAGKPILFDWKIETRRLMNNSPDFGSPISEALKNTHTGYMLTATDSDGNVFYGEIIGQRGNFLTLKLYDDLLNERETEAFVCWPAVSKFASMEINLTRQVADLQYTAFEESFNIKCRPKFSF